jgi:hypothetical protein
MNHFYLTFYLRKIGERKEERDKLYIEIKNLQKEYHGLNASFKHFSEHVENC